MTAQQAISADEAVTLPGLFRERVRRTPNDTAYRFYDSLNDTWIDTTWVQMQHEIERWQAALAGEKLKTGDRVAIMARNSRFWVMFDQAALALGLVVVPIYTEDRVENVEYVLNDSGARLLVIGGPLQWDRLRPVMRELRGLKRIVSIAEIGDGDDRRLSSLSRWLGRKPVQAKLPGLEPKALATIVYTSGTTGRPKGVMLSHRNILSNAWSGLQTVSVAPGHVFLSFLPLSHTFERTIGYYLPIMAGAAVAHARSIQELPQDLQVIRPTTLIAVPRIFERVHARIMDNLTTQPAVSRRLFELAVEVGWRRFQHAQGIAGWHPGLLLWPLLNRLVAGKVTRRLGGQLQVIISGGAALSPDISRVFIAMGLPLLQGYGLTEASPVISVNRLDKNRPASVGIALPGVEVRIAEDGELLVKGENVMLGFWNNPDATARVLDEEGWLHTGDKARIEDEHVYITGRIKDIIVLSNGEKVSPTDMEHAILKDPLFEQMLLIGEGRPFLTAVAVLDAGQWRQVAAGAGLMEDEFRSPRAEHLFLKRISDSLHTFPGYARVHRVFCTREEWTVENGLLTPTLKTRRNRVLDLYREQVEHMYAGHASSGSVPQPAAAQAEAE